MSKPVKKKIGAKITIAFVMLVIIICGAISVGAWATDGFKYKYNDVIITYNGNSVTAGSPAANNLTLPVGEKVRVDIAEAFSKLGAKIDYSISIVPTEGVNFDFRLDGELVAFRAVGDVSDVFDIDKHDNFFTIDTTVRGLASTIQSHFPDRAVTAIPKLNVDSFFTLVISANGKIITIDLPGIVSADLEITGITIDQLEIIF